MQLRTETSVYAQELFVHDRCQGQGAERIHTCFVDSLRVLVLAFQLEREVVCQMSALMIAS